jgi:hypothetical protein
MIKTVPGQHWIWSRTHAAFDVDSNPRFRHIFLAAFFLNSTLEACQSLHCSYQVTLHQQTSGDISTLKIIVHDLWRCAVSIAGASFICNAKIAKAKYAYEHMIALLFQHLHKLFAAMLMFESAGQKGL